MSKKKKEKTFEEKLTPYEKKKFEYNRLVFENQTKKCIQFLIDNFDMDKEKASKAEEFYRKGKESWSLDVFFEYITKGYNPNKVFFDYFNK